jgi:hypothetical protein
LKEITGKVLNVELVRGTPPTEWEVTMQVVLERGPTVCSRSKIQRTRLSKKTARRISLAGGLSYTRRESVRANLLYKVSAERTADTSVYSRFALVSSETAPTAAPAPAPTAAPTGPPTIAPVAAPAAAPVPVRVEHAPIDSATAKTTAPMTIAFVIYVSSVARARGLALLIKLSQAGGCSELPQAYGHAPGSQNAVPFQLLLIW